MKAHELIRALRLPSGQRRELRQVLRTLEAQGQVTRIRKNRWAVSRPADTRTGQLTVQPGGFGFVRVEGMAEDIFIPRRQMGVALHGDQVEVTITHRDRAGPRHHGRRRHRPSPADGDTRLTGRVVAVHERRFTKLAGVLKVTPHYRYVIPDNPRITMNCHVQSVTPGLEPLADGHRVVVELLPWEVPGTPAPGRVIEDLGPADTPESAMRGILYQHDLDPDFPEPVEALAAPLQPAPTTGRMAIERRDLRDRLLVTIDPEDARDYDDAVSLTRTPDGDWELGVHIADVPAYLEPGDVVDEEARRRATSVYLVDRVIQMLPQHLTENVCSLAPQGDRWAHTVEMRLSPRGRLLEVETYPSVIRSAARLTYDGVQAHLKRDPAAPPWEEPVVALLRDMRQLAACLRRKRARGGSILFEMPEVRCELDAAGEPVAIVPRRSHEAYQLIEEFMLLANQAVARRIAAAGYPCIYRVHASPDEDQWDQIEADLAALGHVLPQKDRAGLNAVAAAVHGQPAAHITNLAMLRNMKRAIYTAERAEHFGLAFSHYLHFTSPIRRYPDLLVHRILNRVEQGAPPPYSQKDLAAMAAHCSAREQAAAEAEQESVDLKRIAFYARQLANGTTGPYPALVTGLTGRGLLVELADTLQRGLVPFALLQDDHYRVGTHRNRGVGRSTRRHWQMGDTLEVELIRVDQARKWVDFRPWPAAEASRKRHRSK